MTSPMSSDQSQPTTSGARYDNNEPMHTSQGNENAEPDIQERQNHNKLDNYEATRRKYRGYLHEKKWSSIHSSLTRIVESNRYIKMGLFVECLQDVQVLINAASHGNFNLFAIIEIGFLSAPTVGYESMEILFKKFPKLLLLGKQANNQNLLHLAVSLQDFRAAKIYIEGVKKILDIVNVNAAFTLGVNQPPMEPKSDFLSGFTRLFRSSKINQNYSHRDTAFEAEFPLLMAAWNGDQKMFKLLLENGAHINKTTTNGDNAFHVIIMASANIRESDEIGQEERQYSAQKLNEMFDWIISHILHDGINIPPTQPKRNISRLRLLNDMLNLKNVKGYTPLTLSAKLCCPELFDIIINKSQIFRTLDRVDAGGLHYLYDVTYMDSALREKDLAATDSSISSYSSTQRSDKDQHRSVLELVVSSSSRNPLDYCQFTQRRPIINLIQIKWKSYSKYFWSWAFIHLAFMVLFSVSCVYRYEAMAVTFPANSSGSYGSSKTEYSQTTHQYAVWLYFQNWYGILQAVFEALFAVYCMFLFAIEIVVLVNRRNFYPTNELGDAFYRVMLLCLAPLVLATVGCRFTTPLTEIIPLALLVIFGWMFCLFFIRGIKRFSFFIVMIQTAILGDMMGFVFVYLLALIAFSVPTYLIDHAIRPSNADFASYWLRLITQFYISVGLAEIPDQSGTGLHTFGIVVYVFFILLAHILLLNILIGLLSDACSKVSENKQAQWYLQKLHIILFIESHLPPSMRYRVVEEPQSSPFGIPDVHPSAPIVQLSDYRSAPNPQDEIKPKKSKRYMLDVKITTPPSVSSQFTLADLKYKARDRI